MPVPFLHVSSNTPRLQSHVAAGDSVVVRRVGAYYSEARLEGLAHKDEQVGAKTIERYVGRPDGLLYRSVTYGAPLPDDAAVRCQLCVCLAAELLVLLVQCHVRRAAAGRCHGTLLASLLFVFM